jgi:hypothetical protein
MKVFRLGEITEFYCTGHLNVDSTKNMRKTGKIRQFKLICDVEQKVLQTIT